LLPISDLIKLLEDESGLILADPIVALGRWKLQPPSVPVQSKVEGFALKLGGSRELELPSVSRGLRVEG
jgi:hypothetical protein